MLTFEAGPGDQLEAAEHMEVHREDEQPVSLVRYVLDSPSDTEDRVKPEFVFATESEVVVAAPVVRRTGVLMPGGYRRGFEGARNQERELVLEEMLLLMFGLTALLLGGCRSG